MTLQTRSIPPQRTLLLTLDAFGTLFYPRPSVPEQYASTAHQFGLPTTVTASKLKTAFKDVFRAQSKRYPNYGRADVLRGKYGGPRQWWEEVIRESFAHVLLGPGQGSSSSSSFSSKDLELPVGLIDALLNRFAGEGGYTLYDDVAPFFARMRELRTSKSPGNFDRVVLGVISNSDDRVPAVLKALGLRVGEMRADQDLSSMQLPGFEQRVVPTGARASESGRSDLDVDMVITSYEAGEEKPNRLIFDVAKRQAGLLVDNNTQAGPALIGGKEMGDWVCVHVGDDYEKDYRAAIDAGWQSYLLRGDGQHTAKSVNSLVDLFDELQIG
jgi:FMN phosphatase YigB (HAD superfamily)